MEQTRCHMAKERTQDKEGTQGMERTQLENTRQLTRLHKAGENTGEGGDTGDGETTVRDHKTVDTIARGRRGHRRGRKRQEQTRMHDGNKREGSKEFPASCHRN